MHGCVGQTEELSTVLWHARGRARVVLDEMCARVNAHDTAASEGRNAAFVPALLVAARWRCDPRSCSLSYLKASSLLRFCMILRSAIGHP